MNLLRKIRLQKKMSQQELAAASGVPQGVISDIESGVTRNPRVDTAIKIANALGCSIDELFRAPTNNDKAV